MKYATLFATFLLVLTPGCAATVGPEARLTEARQLLDRVNADASCAGPTVEDAERALDYAAFEDQAAPGHPLAAYRAQVALQKAQQAEAACREVAGR